MTLKFLQAGSQQITDAQVQLVKGVKNESHVYYNQASNILEMEKRYEIPLTANPYTATLAVPLTTNPGAHMMVHAGHEMKMVNQNALGLDPSMMGQ